MSHDVLRKEKTRTNRSNTGRTGEISIRKCGNKRSKINYEAAQDFEIWEVARAATATPFYFEPLSIRIPRSEAYMLFTDGGFDTTNNPTKEGIHEIVSMHGRNSVGVVVSIGTARRDERAEENGLLSVIPRIRGFVQNATNPEVIHDEVGHMSHPDKFPYYRLNDPGSMKVELDEWEPKRGMFKHRATGSGTIRTIKDTFNTWAGRPEIVTELQECAVKLVERRRARSLNGTKWERYATCARFTCQLRACNIGAFTNEDDFRNHLRGHHALATRDQLDQEVKECRRRWRYQPAGGQ